jgi:hypothetical protein
MSPSLRKYLNTEVVIMDVLPPLMEIIQPNLRPINTQLYSAREKEDMSQLRYTRNQADYHGILRVCSSPNENLNLLV